MEAREPAATPGAHGEIEVFATGTTLLVRHGSDEDGTPDEQILERLRRVAAAAHELGHDAHARPGRRLGHQPGVALTSSRRGGGCDIVRPVPIQPRLACALALSGAFVTGDVPHLDVRRDGSDGQFLVWRARITGRRMRAVPAALRLLGTPSGAVTVIELVPTRRVRWRRDRVVANGVVAVEALARRIEQLAARGA